MGYVKNYPEWYSLHEVTSLMGGRFNIELTLKFEKSLLALVSSPGNAPTLVSA